MYNLFNNLENLFRYLSSELYAELWFYYSRENFEDNWWNISLYLDCTVLRIARVSSS